MHRVRKFGHRLRLPTLHDAGALTRRLPAPPVAAINREQYAELGRLAANLNQLTRLANEGQRVTIANDLLGRLRYEVSRLRLGLLGASLTPDTDARASK